MNSLRRLHHLNFVVVVVVVVVKFWGRLKSFSPCRASLFNSVPELVGELKAMKFGSGKSREELKVLGTVARVSNHFFSIYHFIILCFCFFRFGHSNFPYQHARTNSSGDVQPDLNWHIRSHLFVDILIYSITFTLLSERVSLFLVEEPI